MSFVEQQIYASLDLPGVRAGHHTHATTPGLDPVSIERHEQICNRWGQYETGTEFRRAVLHLPQWLDARPPAAPSHHLVILITHQGRDASGRPGALLRHVVRLDDATYRAWGGHPFRLLREGALLQEWTPDTLFPEIGSRSAGNSIAELQSIDPAQHATLRALLQRVHAQGRLHLPTSADSEVVEKTLEQLHCLLPIEQRCRLSMASFLYHNTSDYLLAAVRQEESDFEAGLRALCAEAAPALPAAAEQGLERLFVALQNQDWGRAAAVLEDPESSGTLRALDSTTETATEPATESSGPAAAEASAAGDAFAEDEFRPSYRRRSGTARAHGGGRRGKFLTGFFVLLVAAAAVWWLSGREPSRSIEPGPEASAGSAPSLAALVEREEARLGRLLANGARDFDVAEALRDGGVSLQVRLAGTLDRERESLDEDLRRAAAGAGDDDPIVRVAGALGGAADVAQEASARLVTLDRVSRDADPAALRAFWSEEAKVLRFPPASTGEETPGAGPALAWSEGLVGSAVALQEWPRVAEGALEPGTWASYAEQLSLARERFPDGVQAPAVLAAADGAAAAIADWLGVLESVDPEAAARDDADAFAFLQEDPLRAATLDLRANLAALEREGVDFEGPLAGLRAWIDAGTAARDALRSRDGAEALATLALVCREFPSFCAEEPYVSAMDRWRLQAWLEVGGPGSGEGASLLEEWGDAALPRGGRANLDIAVRLLGRVRSAPSPASPELVRDVASDVGSLGNTLAAARVQSWLRAQRRDVARAREGFSAAYSELRGALERLRGASALDVNAAFSELRSAMSAIDDDLLTQAEGGSPDRVAAVRALRSAWDRPVPYEWTRCEVQLLRETDYAGKLKKVVTLEIRLVRAGDAELARASAPPSLYAPGAGFERVALAPGVSVPLRASDRILAVGRDAEDGALWWHLYAEAPAGGHVLQSLARAREVRVSDDVAQRALASPDSPPPPDGGGAAVARVRFEFADGWWRRFASQLPVLPQ